MEIRFTAHYGNGTKQIEISGAAGSGGDSLHFYIDKYYQGMFLKRFGKWEWVPQMAEKDNLTIDDIQILISMISKDYDK